MLKYIVSVLFLPVVVFAQETVQKPVICGPLNTIVQTITSQYNESPKWVGEDESSKYVLFANEKSGTWTLIQFDQKNACVLGAGEGHKLIAPKNKNTI